MDLRSVEDLPGLHRLIQGDCSDSIAVRDGYAGLSKQEGRLDALVNNAALHLPKSLAETTLEEWDGVMAVNIRSVFLNSKDAHDLLRRQGGAIVNVSSVHAAATSADIAAYAASKGAVLQFTRAMAIDHAREGIRVNAICPGPVDTPLLRGFHDNPEERIQIIEENTPMGRIGTPDEIAGAIAFLASDDASFMTGSALFADGGVTAA